MNVWFEVCIYCFEYVRSFDELKPGDIVYYIMLDCPYGETCVFWNQIHHVMIFLDKDKVLHCTLNDNYDLSGVVIQSYKPYHSYKTFSFVVLRFTELS